MKHPRSLTAFCLVVFLCGTVAAADYPNAVITQNNTLSGGGVVYTWDVPPELGRKAPRWTPDDATIPLSVERATQIAKQWVSGQQWSEQFKDFFDIKLAHLTDLAGQPVDNLWVYEFQLNFRPAPSAHWSPEYVVILLDGTVIEPASRPPSLSAGLGDLIESMSSNQVDRAEALLKKLDAQVTRLEAISKRQGDKPSEPGPNKP